MGGNVSRALRYAERAKTDRKFIEYLERKKAKKRNKCKCGNIKWKSSKLCKKCHNSKRSRAYYGGYWIR